MSERLNGSREPIASRVERDVQRRVMADLQRNPPGAAGPTTESSSTSSSSDLTSSLVTRLVFGFPTTETVTTYSFYRAA